MPFQTKSTLKSRSNHKKNTFYVNKCKRSIMYMKKKLQEKCMYKE